MPEPAPDRVHQALAESEARYRSLAEQLPSVLLRYDRDLRVSYLNPAAEEATGIPAGRFVGLTNREAGMPSALCDLWDPAIANVFDGGAEHDLEFAFETRRGVRTFYLTLAPERDVDGVVRHVLGLATDITARKQAEALVLRQSAVLEGIARILGSVISTATEAELGRTCLEVAEQVTVSQFGFLAELDREGRLAIVTMSEPGWDTNGLARQPDGSLITLAVHGLYGRVVTDGRGFYTNDPAHHPDRVGLPPGHPPLRSFLGVPLRRDGRVTGLVAVGNREGGYGRDDLDALESLAPTMVEAFARTRAEQALRGNEQRWRALAQDLERADARLRRQQEWLRTANERLVIADRRKDEFLSTLSHELRTPLNAIVGWSQMLERGMLDGAAQQKAVEVIARNALLQARIIDDVLDVSRIVTGKVTLDARDIDLARVIHQATESVRPSLEAKRIDLAVGVVPGVIVRGDAGRLQQVFWNLLSNAAKFTPEDGRVTVTLDRDDKACCVRIRDTGVGIAPAFLPHVFERFAQADASPSRRHGGLGLGLAIVRHLVELHGGSVGAESGGEAEGATFTVRLSLAGVRDEKPVEAGADPATGAPRSDDLGGDLRGVHVLAVDDERDARELVKAVLERDGATVTLASSAREAMAQIESAPFDLLIADIGMPDEDGYELLRRVRQRSPVPAIALTAYGREADRTMAAAAGFADHLTKPVLPHQLLAVARIVAARPGS